MKTTFLILLLASSIALSAQEKNNSSTKNSKSMNTTLTSEAPVKAFFQAYSKGDYQGILDVFHPETTITAVREGAVNGYIGTYKGIDGVKEFLTNLGKTFDTQLFTVENIVGGHGVAFANGKFVQKVKATEKRFASDWALYAVIKDGKIYEYHFYEDSAKFEEANR